MDFDIGAAVLYVILASVMVFLVYLLFDVRSLYADVRSQKYENGHPRHEALRSARGVVKIEGADLIFKDPSEGSNYFSIPVNSIRRVSREALDARENSNVFRSLAGALDERDYLYIEYEEAGHWHKVRLSSHKASPVNDEILRDIVTARNDPAIIRQR
jgi:hypothetical protein